MTIAATSRMTMVAFGASTAALTYSASLVAQRVVPGLADLLALPVGGVHPTYFARVLGSLVVGALAAALGRNRALAERSLTWGTALAFLVSVVLACAVP